MQQTSTLPGGIARRTRAAGLRAGARRTTIRGPMHALALVSEELTAAEHVLRDLVVSDVAAVGEIASYLVQAGGKRLRPALTALGARAVGASDRIEQLMCAGELIHLGSLLHDDVVDEAPERRGQPAAHALHGSAVSVLTGDFCVARALLVAGEVGGPVATTELARTVVEMAEGEVLQLQRAGRLDQGYEGYLDVIDRKSASLIAWCASAAAWQVGDEAAAKALGQFGRKVGVAYQITDDVLDYRADTGKVAGADLRERKVTLPLLLAFEALPGLRDELRAGEPSAERIVTLIEEVRGTGALSRSLDVARGFVDEALAALHVLPPNEGRDALEALAHFLVERTS